MKISTYYAKKVASSGILSMNLLCVDLYTCVLIPYLSYSQDLSRNKTIQMTFKMNDAHNFGHFSLFYLPCCQLPSFLFCIHLSIPKRHTKIRLTFNLTKKALCGSILLNTDISVTVINFYEKLRQQHFTQ